MSSRRFVRQRRRHFMARVLGIIVLASAMLVGWERVASAYPWMLRHEYTSCGNCHIDPSGAGLMTLYGRAQSEVLLRTHYGGAAGEEDPTLGGFLFGAVPLPDKGLRVQADGRGLFLRTSPPAPAPSVSRVILMQADAYAGLELDDVRASASLGYAHEGALAASVTRGDDRIVSRQHWLGVAFGKDRQFLARAGRMNLPFGVRTLEHTLWVRSATRTDINAAQQHGAALSYTGENVRAEIMAVLGNFQLAPPSLRERGYAGYAELATSQKAAVGVSSLVLHTDYEPEARAPAFRQAHGFFGRFAPWKPLVVLAETDLLVSSPKRRTLHAGVAGMVQLDFEVVQGVHAIATGEVLDRTLARSPMSYGGWLSLQWFFLPHVDIRVDAIGQSLASESSRIEVFTVLGQIHAFL